MGDEPIIISAVAGKTAANDIVNAATRHCIESVEGGIEFPSPACGGVPFEYFRVRGGGSS